MAPQIVEILENFPDKPSRVVKSGSEEEMRKTVSEIAVFGAKYKDNTFSWRFQNDANVF